MLVASSTLERGVSSRSTNLAVYCQQLYQGKEEKRVLLEKYSGMEH